MDQILIEHLTPDFLGKGIAPNGKNTTFPYTLPGDLLSVEVLKKKRGRSKVIVKEFLHKEERGIIPCPHFSICGGCSGQHIEYQTQCDLKFNPIQTAFLEFLNIPLTLLPAKETYHYRSRMDFSVFPGPLIGLRARGNFRHVVNIDACYIQSMWANAELAIIRKVVNEFPDLPWDRREESGGLKYLTLRTGKFTNDTISIFTFTEGFENHPSYKAFCDRALAHSTAKNIVHCFNRIKSEVSAQGRSTILRGNAGFEEEIFGKKFFVPFDSFFQPNPAGFLPILNFIQNSLPRQKTNLTDLFCGNGFFSLLFGKNFTSINCYELTPSSIETAKQLLEIDYPDVSIQAKVVNLFQDTSPLEKIPDGVIIVDPPRAGCGIKVNQWLKDFGPKDLFYVSCNPYSQLEDVKLFISAYEAVSGILIDPYPQTPHCESVIHFRRR